MRRALLWILGVLLLAAIMPSAAPGQSTTATLTLTPTTTPEPTGTSPTLTITPSPSAANTSSLTVTPLAFPRVELAIVSHGTARSYCPLYVTVTVDGDARWDRKSVSAPQPGGESVEALPVAGCESLLVQLDRSECDQNLEYQIRRDGLPIWSYTPTTKQFRRILEVVVASHHVSLAPVGNLVTIEASGMNGSAAVGDFWLGGYCDWRTTAEVDLPYGCQAMRAYAGGSGPPQCPDGSYGDIVVKWKEFKATASAGADCWWQCNWSRHDAVVYSAPEGVLFGWQAQELCAGNYEWQHGQCSSCATTPTPSPTNTATTPTMTATPTPTAVPPSPTPVEDPSLGLEFVVLGTGADPVPSTATLAVTAEDFAETHTLTTPKAGGELHIQLPMPECRTVRLALTRDSREPSRDQKYEIRRNGVALWAYAPWVHRYYRTLDVVVLEGAVKVVPVGQPVTMGASGTPGRVTIGPMSFEGSKCTWSDSIDIDLQPGCYPITVEPFESGQACGTGVNLFGLIRTNEKHAVGYVQDDCTSGVCRRRSQRGVVFCSPSGITFGAEAEAMCPGDYTLHETSCSFCSPSPTPWPTRTPTPTATPEPSPTATNTPAAPSPTPAARLELIVQQIVARTPGPEYSQCLPTLSQFSDLGHSETPIGMPGPGADLTYALPTTVTLTLEIASSAYYCGDLNRKYEIRHNGSAIWAYTPTLNGYRRILTVSFATEGTRVEPVGNLVTISAYGFNGSVQVGDIDFRGLSCNWQQEIEADLPYGCHPIKGYARDTGGFMSGCWDAAYAAATVTWNGTHTSGGAGDQCFSYCSASYQNAAVYSAPEGVLFGDVAEAQCPGDYESHELPCSAYSHCAPSATIRSTVISGNPCVPHGDFIVRVEVADNPTGQAPVAANLRVHYPAELVDFVSLGEGQLGAAAVGPETSTTISGLPPNYRNVSTFSNFSNTDSTPIAFDLVFYTKPGVVREPYSIFVLDNTDASRTLIDATTANIVHAFDNESLNPANVSCWPIPTLTATPTISPTPIPTETPGTLDLVVWRRVGFGDGGPATLSWYRDDEASPTSVALETDPNGQERSFPLPSLTTGTLTLDLYRSHRIRPEQTAFQLRRNGTPIWTYEPATVGYNRTFRVTFDGSSAAVESVGNVVTITAATRLGAARIGDLDLRTDYILGYSGCDTETSLETVLPYGCHPIECTARATGDFMACSNPYWGRAAVFVRWNGGEVSAEAKDDCSSYCYAYDDRVALYSSPAGIAAGPAAEALCSGEYGRKDRRCYRIECLPTPTIPPTDTPTATTTPTLTLTPTASPTPTISPTVVATTPTPTVSPTAVATTATPTVSPTAVATTATPTATPTPISTLELVVRQIVERTPSTPSNSCWPTLTQSGDLGTSTTQIAMPGPGAELSYPLVMGSTGTLSLGLVGDAPYCDALNRKYEIRQGGTTIWAYTPAKASYRRALTVSFTHYGATVQPVGNLVEISANGFNGTVRVGSIDFWGPSCQWWKDMEVDLPYGCHPIKATARDTGGYTGCFDAAYAAATVRWNGTATTGSAGDQCFSYCSAGYRNAAVYSSPDGVFFGAVAEAQCPGDYADHEQPCYWAHCNPTPRPTVTATQTTTPTLTPTATPTISPTPAPTEIPSTLDLVVWRRVGFGEGGPAALTWYRADESSSTSVTLATDPNGEERSFPLPSLTTGTLTLNLYRSHRIRPEPTGFQLRRNGTPIWTYEPGTVGYNRTFRVNFNGDSAAVESVGNVVTIDASTRMGTADVGQIDLLTDYSLGRYGCDTETSLETVLPYGSHNVSATAQSTGIEMMCSNPYFASSYITLSWKDPVTTRTYSQSYSAYEYCSSYCSKYSEAGVVHSTPGGVYAETYGRQWHQCWTWGCFPTPTAVPSPEPSPTAIETTATLTLTPSPTPSPQAAPVIDALLEVGRTPSPEEFDAWDGNDDGVWDAADVVAEERKRVVGR